MATAKIRPYVRRFTENREVVIDGFEIPVPLPDMPPRREMVNNVKFLGLEMQVPKQKFVRTVIPADLQSWQKPQKDVFIAEEWHRRINGVWVLIKGDPYYFPGTAYVYFNYWYTERGTLPDFRMEALEYFWINDMIERDPNCYGILDIKCRRLGDTEKELFLGWEIATRYKNSWFGMQNQSEPDAKANFTRAVIGAQRMPFFFQPVLFSGDTPQEVMVWRFPQQSAGNKRTDRRLELNSKMDFRATKDRAYDGKRLRRYHLDEPGKISPTVMHVLNAWEIVRMTLSMYNGKVIVGKAALTTTVEELGDGSAVEIIQALWDQSDPSDLNANGRTTSGLYRCFRSYLLAAEVDEWGFHKMDEAKRQRDNDIEGLRRKGKYDQIVALKRRQPANIHEALATSGTDCILGAHLIDEQTSQVEEMLAGGRDWPQRAVRGDFHWSEAFGSAVMWRPSEHGKFYVSGHPPRPNSRHHDGQGWLPDNTGQFAGGADPIDHMQTKKTKKKQVKGEEDKNGASDAALAIGRIFDLANENEDLEFDEFGNIENTEAMATNRCVCTYRNRPFDPHIYYEDVLKALIYFGCQCNVEMNKPGIMVWLMQKGYGGYLSRKPVTLDRRVLMTGRQRRDDIGTTSTVSSIGSYVESIVRHNTQFIGTHTHLDLLRDMRKFNGEADNRTKRDITVAWGMARTLMDSISFVEERNSKKKPFTSAPFSLFSQEN